MRLVPVTNPAEAMSVLNWGAAQRATGATNLNETSSRSHLVMQIHVTTTMRNTPLPTATSSSYTTSSSSSSSSHSFDPKNSCETNTSVADQDRGVSNPTGVRSSDALLDPPSLALGLEEVPLSYSATLFLVDLAGSERVGEW